MKVLSKLFVLGMLAVLVACNPQAEGVQAPGQRPVQEQQGSDLAGLIESGAVALVEARGNGASSGNSIDALLRNDTQSELEVDVFMREPVFFVNGGVGQNMVGSMVLGADGSYSQVGDRSVVTLEPGQQFEASIVAYCADMGKENPSHMETFQTSAAPVHLASVIGKVNDYVRANPNADVTAAAQVAIWMAQGEEPADIATKFPFTSADERLARRFIE